MASFWKKKDKKQARRIRIVTVVLCYLVVAGCWASVNLLRFTLDRRAYANGSLQTQAVHIANFEHTNIAFPKKKNEHMIQINGRSLLTLKNTSGAPFRSLHFKADFVPSTPHIRLYYTTTAEETFSENKYILPTLQPDGSYYFVLPFKSIYAVQLELLSGNTTAEFQYIYANEPLTAKQYFTTTTFSKVMLSVGPLVLSLIVMLLAILFHHIRNVVIARRWLRHKKAEIEKAAKENIPL